MTHEYENCPGKIHIENITKEQDEMKADQKSFKTDIYNKLDGISKWMIAGMTSILLSIITAIVLYLIIGG